MLLSQT
jgi:capsule polysaccharide export protein KpsE/RkpR